MSVIKAGTTLVLTTGEYSDYRDHGPFTVLKDFDQAELRDAFTEHWRAQPHDSWESSPDYYSFMGWLNSEGYVADIEGSRSWHLGSYNFEPDIDPPAEEES